MVFAFSPIYNCPPTYVKMAELVLNSGVMPLISGGKQESLQELGQIQYGRVKVWHWDRMVKPWDKTYPEFPADWLWWYERKQVHSLIQESGPRLPKCYIQLDVGPEPGTSGLAPEEEDEPEG
jgi:hypothetical protein